MLHIIKDIFTRPQVRPLGAALLLATALTACEDQLPTVDTSAGNGPTLTLCIDNEEEDPATRTSLDNADPTHHVKAVKILIFKGRGDDATYLDQETLTWTADVDGNRVDRKEYTLQHLFTEEGDYTLLGVGMDAATDDAFNYDFKDASNPGNPTELTAGTTTLANAYACLKDGKSPADCEFFTGTVSFTYRKNHNIEVDDLLMRRRVAGVMLYVTDIPQNLYPTNGDNTVEYRTTKIYVKAGRVQKKSVRLQRDFNDPEAWDEPEGTPLYDEANATDEQKILLELDLTELVKYDKNTTGNETYTIPATDNHLANTLYTSCYMLPLNAEENNTNYKTFSVEIWGVENADGTGSTLTEGTPKEEALLKTFYVENKSQATDKTKYDIRSNYIYCIGKNWEGTENDQPVSLLGENIYLDVLAWTDIEQDVTFEPARIQAIFNPDFSDDFRFNCINNEFTVEILPSINGETWEILIPQGTQYMQSIPGIEDADRATWALDEDGEEKQVATEWLYIKTKDDNGKDVYRTTYEATEEEAKNGTTLTFLMLDYAQQRSWGWGETSRQWIGGTLDNGKDVVDLINNDVRSINVILTTNPTGAQPRTDKMTITQYNTITVNYKDEDADDDEIAVCGFSRVDVGDMFQYNKDEVVPDVAYREEHNPIHGGKTTFWGFTQSNSDWIYSAGSGTGNKADGAINKNNIGWIFPDNKFDPTWTISWGNSAMQLSHHPFKKISNESLSASTTPVNKDTRTNTGWYLPAEYEMEGFLLAYMKSNWAIHTNVDQGDNYWTSTLKSYSKAAIVFTATPDWTYRNKVKRIEVDKSMGAEKENGAYSQYYLRQARKFADYYENNWP